MKTYTVLEPRDGKPEHVVFVPEGFAWAALVFTVLWALWQRMWIVAALLFALMAALGACESYGLLDAGLVSLLQLGIALIFGFEARSLQVRSLAAAGFRRAGLVRAGSREAAELAYFAGRAAAAPTPGRVHIKAAPEDTLGIFGNV